MQNDVPFYLQKMQLMEVLILFSQRARTYCVQITLKHWRRLAINRYQKDILPTKQLPAAFLTVHFTFLDVNGNTWVWTKLPNIWNTNPFSLCCLTVDTITRKNLVMEFHEILLYPNPNYLLVNFQIDNKWNICDLQIAYSLDRVFQLLLPHTHTYTVEILFNMTLTWMMIHLRQQYLRMDKKWNMVGQLQNSSEFSFHFVSSSCWWG